MEKLPKYLMVETEALPEVFVKVMEAKMLLAAGEVYAGLLALQILQEPPGVHIGIDDLLPLILRLAQQTGDGAGFTVKEVQRRGQGDDPAEGIVVLQTVAHGAEAAHAQATDEGVLALVRQREHPPGDLDQLLADPLAVVRVEAGPV